METPRMPVLPFVSSLYPDSDFSKTLIIACQHLLGTQLSLFKELFQKGLEPRNLFLIGKNYSTSGDVYQEFLKQDVQVALESKEYNSKLSFDVQFQKHIETFLTRVKNSVSFKDYSRIIIVDEGGHLLCSRHMLEGPFLDTVGVEQTSSGYEKIKHKQFDFPVINVARSYSKLESEAPIIAGLVVRKIKEYLRAASVSNPNILVVGQGPIGVCTKDLLQQDFTVKAYDVLSHKSDLEGDYRKELQNFNVIIGATGKPILTPEDFPLLKKGTHLISISSSDREFSGVELRRRSGAGDDIHTTIESDGIFLVNSGFPINFTGGVESLPTKDAQLTVSLMLASMYEANTNLLPKGLSELNPKIQADILTFLRI